MDFLARIMKNLKTLNFGASFRKNFHVVFGYIIKRSNLNNLMLKKNELFKNNHAQ